MCSAARNRNFREGNLYEFALMATLGSRYVAVMLSQKEGVYYRICIVTFYQSRWEKVGGKREGDGLGLKGREYM
jgi:hypothetical protein